MKKDVLKRICGYISVNKILLLAIAAFVITVFVAVGSLFSKKEEIIPYQPLTAEEIELIRSNTELEGDTQIIIDSGLSLVGKVPYFWGGKSAAVGFDERFGQPMLVESSGSDTSGEYLPFGLDCSGFVSWCLIQTGISEQEMIEILGHGTKNQWNHSDEISWEELRPGDFVFQYSYPEASENHIGICIGFDEAKRPVFMHCASSLGGVVVTYASDVFKYARRPYYALYE